MSEELKPEVKQQLSPDKYIPENLAQVPERVREDYTDSMKKRLETVLKMTPRELQIQQIGADMNVERFVPEAMSGGEFSRIYGLQMEEHARLVRRVMENKGVPFSTPEKGPTI